MKYEVYIRRYVLPGGQRGGGDITQRFPIDTMTFDRKLHDDDDDDIIVTQHDLGRRVTNRRRQPVGK